MTYRVTVDFAPAYELVMSLDAYLVAPSHRTLELGADWVTATRAALPPQLQARLGALPEPPLPALTSLIRQCPAPRDAAGFLAWLRSLSPGELYERLAADAPPGQALPADLGAVRDDLADLLEQWDAAYFAHVDPTIITHLQEQAKALNHAQIAPVQLVEEATRGYYIEPNETLTEIRLIPQYHKRPIPLYVQGRGTLTFYVPAAALPPAPGEPGADLLRLVRALGDESRLRIARYLAGGPRSFNEVVAASGLTKGTVHRHLWTLRFAGLVRANFADGRLQLRPGAFQQVADRLTDFAAGDR